MTLHTSLIAVYTVSLGHTVSWQWYNNRSSCSASAKALRLLWRDNTRPACTELIMTWDVLRYHHFLNLKLVYWYCSCHQYVLLVMLMLLDSCIVNGPGKADWCYLPVRLRSASDAPVSLS